jgi:hypothetical protein
MNRFFSAKGMALVLLVAVMSLLLAACAGADGSSGAQGPKGDQGDQGQQGGQGDTGRDGPTGRNGADGGDGKNGKAGADGKDGKNGTNGKAGSNGSNGSNGADGRPGAPGPQGEAGWSNIDLASMSATADSAISITAYLTGWSDGEVVSVQLVSPDGSTADLEGATTPGSGVSTVTLTHAGVAAGVYSVEATGSSGGKASAALVVSAGK